MFGPIEKKIKTSAYPNFDEFKKDIETMYKTLLEKGQKLHNYHLAYAEMTRKAIVQGAEFLTKNLTNDNATMKARIDEKEKVMIQEN